MTVLLLFVSTVSLYTTASTWAKHANQRVFWFGLCGKERLFGLFYFKLENIYVYSVELTSRQTSFCLHLVSCTKTHPMSQVNFLSVNIFNIYICNATFWIYLNLHCLHSRVLPPLFVLLHSSLCFYDCLPFLHCTSCRLNVCKS